MTNGILGIRNVPLPFIGEEGNIIFTYTFYILPTVHHDCKTFDILLVIELMMITKKSIFRCKQISVIIAGFLAWGI